MFCVTLRCVWNLKAKVFANGAYSRQWERNTSILVTCKMLYELQPILHSGINEHYVSVFGSYYLWLRGVFSAALLVEELQMLLKCTRSTYCMNNIRTQIKVTKCMRICLYLRIAHSPNTEHT